MLADINAVGAVFANIGDWNLDWSDQGVNVGDPKKGINSGAPYFVAHPMFQQKAQAGQAPPPPTFYLVFHPAGNISPDGTGQPMLIDPSKKGMPDETWAIRNYADLHALFCGVLTQLTDLSQGPRASPNKAP